MELVEKILKIALPLYMILAMFELGLKIHFAESVEALKDKKFIFFTVLFSFIVAPAIAWGVATLLPIHDGYAMGLTILGLAPCSPFLPIVAEKSKCNLAYVGVYLLITTIGIVIYLPLTIGFFAPAVTISALSIAKPLLILLITPLLLGIVIQQINYKFASASHPIIKKIGGINLLVMLASVIIFYRSAFFGAFGTFAIGAQVLFYVIVMFVTYFISKKYLDHSQTSVLTLGVATRNIGAAMTPLVASPHIDPRGVAMCVLAVPLSILAASIGAKILGKKQI